MSEQKPVGNGLTLEAQVLEIVTLQLKNEDSVEKARVYDIIENLLQRDCALERVRHEKELQIYLRTREERRNSARRVALTMLGLAVIVFTAGVTLVLRDFEDIGVFLLGCTAAFLGEVLVSYR